MAGNGYFFRTDIQGFLPELMQELYDDRVKFKDLQLDAKRSGDDENVAEYETRQMARKISLNSAYGALGNEYFRYFDVRQAEAITKSGQLAIRWIERELNEFLNQTFQTEDEDFVVASDTDSVYVTLSLLVERYFGTITDKNKIVDAIDKFCRDKVEPFIEQSYQRLADYMGAYQQRMVMKREVIADKGIWTAKKRYVLSVWDSEGVRYEKPDIKIMGIEAVRSSTPSSCRQRIKDSMKIIMDGSNDELLEYIDEFREEFLHLEVAEVAFPRTVKGIDKYSHSVYGYIKGTPIHVKAVIAHNELVKQHDLEKKYPLIKNGEKIKFTYLKVPNPTRDKVIGFINGLPPEFGFDKYIDYDMQFEKAYLEPLKSVLGVVNWNYERIANLESFFI
jgi:DNA polymerase elongation subunit (family B)